MTFVRPDHLALASQLGCIPACKPESVAKQFLGALYPAVLAIAKRERSTVVAVARDIIRQNVEGVA